MPSYSENGAYVAIAGAIVTIASHYGIVIQQSDLIAVIGGLVAIIGGLHLWWNSRNAKNAAIANGVTFKK